jgi:ElaB/YqjD/DUF883 family membrane-anchored ribosome-binding protein
MAHDHAGDPAQAFEDLRAEVSVLRRAIEALPASIRETRPPDYSQDLAVIGNGLDEIGERLEAVLKSPALSRTPEQQGQAIANAGANLIREAAQKLDRAAQEAERERARLAAIVGQAQAQDRHFRTICWTGGIALAVGLLLSPPAASLFPFGLNTRVAALVLRQDRWSAGATLMNAANPERWAQLTADANLIEGNREAITACRAALAQSGKIQHCSVAMAPANAPSQTAARR